MIRSIVDEATFFRGSFPSKFFFEHFLYLDIAILAGAMFAYFFLLFFVNRYFYAARIDTFREHRSLDFTY